MPRWLIIVGLVLVAGVAAGLLTVWRPSSTGVNSGSEATNGSDLTESGSIEDQPIDQSSVRDQLVSISRRFAERYGTTTSDDPVAHFRSSLPLTTSTLTTSFERLIAQPSTSPKQRLTVTSRALAFRVVTADVAVGRAEMIVSLRRTTTVDHEPATVIDQDLRLLLVLEGSEWRVGQAIWLGAS